MTPPAKTVAISAEGQAKAFFASEWSVDFPAVKVRREWFFDCPDYRAQMEEDGIEEPYDGFPLTCGDANSPGAREFWVLAEECRR